MPFCQLCWRNFPNIKSHNTTNHTHLRGPVQKCNHCSLWFSSKNARARHRTATGCERPPISQFRCCECDEDFDNSFTLLVHLSNKVIHPPRIVRSTDYCEKCDKEFKNATALGQHLASVIHNPIMKSMTCLGGKGCKRKFITPSGMLAHLESGTCASKITREKIDDLVIANDPTNVITDPVAVETRARDRMMITSSMYSSSTEGSVMFTPSEASFDSRSSRDSYGFLTDSDDSDGTVIADDGSSSSGYEGSAADSDSFQYASSSGTATPRIGASSSASGYYYTPSISSDSGSGVFLTPSHSSSGVSTPTSGISLSSQLTAPKLTCPLCPALNTKQYLNMDSLHVHMRSKVHAARIYHCPPAAQILGSEHQDTGKKQKSFVTLSGLAQHVEAGACEGGKETFNVAVSFVNEKLRNMGLSDVKLVEK